MDLAPATQLALIILFAYETPGDFTYYTKISILKVLIKGPKIDPSVEMSKKCFPKSTKIFLHVVRKVYFVGMQIHKSSWN